MLILIFYLSGIMFFIFSFLCLIFSMIMLINNFSFFIEWYVIIFNSVLVNMLIYMDWISLMFIFTVLLISSMIMFYCCEYMNHDMYNIRFFYLLFLFIMSMLLMILSPNMISILIGWDGLGLVSYCLVIYYQNNYSYNSGMLTILLNRIGDVMIIISISMMFIYGSWNFLNYNFMNMSILFFLIIAGFTKSAQFPFSSWLPAAMAAPTPVSSLVHSSTLVTAGIYLMIRFNYLIYNFDILLKLIMFIGLLTMMMAGFSANFEFDLKKIIAFSTLSQLGLMMMIYSLKMYMLSYFHLLTHAMFKSMMFMCSGVLIHSMMNCQDIRFMGNVKNFLPFTLMMFMVSNFSLCGLPFMSGFFSKDLIIETFFMSNFSLFLFLMLILSTLLTLLYSLRLFYYLMMNNINFFSLFKINDFKLMNFPMVLLMIFSVIFGNIFNWLIFNNLELIFLFKFEKIMVLLILMLVFFLFYYFNNLNILNEKNNFMYFFGKMYYLYNINNLFIIFPLFFGKFFIKLFDKGWSEYFMKNSLYINMKLLNNLYLNMNYFIMILYCMGFFIFMMNLI